MKPSESSIQSHVLAQISNEPGCSVLMPNGRMVGDKCPRAVFWRINTGAVSSGSRFIRFGVVGQSDIVGIVNGRFIAMEIKTDTGKQSKEQREYQSNIEFVGGVYLLVHSASEALVAIREILR